MQKKRNKIKKYAAVYLALTAFLLALCLTVNIGMNTFSRNMDFRFGSGEMIVTPAEGTEDWDTAYYASDYANDRQRIEDAARALTERMEGEGIVLLKNEGSALPLDRAQPRQQRVSVFGWSFSHPVYGGSGSGDIDTQNCITPQKGLENAGFSVNPTLVDAYGEWSENTVRLTNWGTQVTCDSRPTVTVSYTDWDIIEMPVSDALAARAAAYSDVALVFLARQGGEGTDLPVTMGANTFYGANRANTSNSFGYDEGKHYLELAEGEKQMLSAVTGAGFEKVIVVINSPNAMELAPLQDSPDIDSVLLIGAPGSAGFNALGKVLSGEIVPSGRTADIFAADFTADPTFPNFSDPTYYAENAGIQRRNEYTNVNANTSAYDHGYFVQYEEGIYMGYRYYETADLLGTIDYGEAVVYPFGYGLSYTSFEQSIVRSSVRGGRVSVTVRVENTGGRAGKDVVQLYYTAPFGAEETGGAPVIEKSAKVLAAFLKTDSIPAGTAEEYTLSFAVEDMASYDDVTAGCYVLDAGTYTIWLGKNSHDSWGSFTYEQSSRVLFDAGNPRESEIAAQEESVLDRSETVAATNAFGEVLVPSEMSKLTLLSREDEFVNFPTEPTDVDRIATDDFLQTIQRYDPAAHPDEDARLPALGRENGLRLADMRGAAYGDPAWDSLLDQLSVDDMVRLVTTGGFGTAGIDSVGKPRTLDNDGPQALKYGDWAGTPGEDETALNAYPSETVIASAWSVQLCEEWGKIVGEEGLAWSTTGWYAPGLNLHRSPFGGRNFEYFSEDPLLSGKLGAAVIGGAASKGILTYPKHFAVNDQESYRSGWKYNTVNSLYTWATEQTMRELYLRSFEIAVKEARVTVRYIADDQGTVQSKEMRAATGMMTGLNAVGSCWAGGNAALLECVLRGEWGFCGTVITDYRSPSRTFMDPDRMLRNGGDLVLYPHGVALDESSSVTAVSRLREACRNILYSYCNSNALQGIAPGSSISYRRAPWQWGITVMWCCSAAVVAAGGIFVAVLWRKEVSEKKEERSAPEGGKI